MKLGLKSFILHIFLFLSYSWKRKGKDNPQLCHKGLKLKVRFQLLRLWIVCFDH